MADKLYISEFNGVCSMGGTQQGQFPPQPSLNDQIVALSGTAAQSTAFTDETTNVVLVTDTACCIAFGEDPTADNTKNLLLPANVPMRFGVVAGQKVSAVTA